MGEKWARKCLTLGPLSPSTSLDRHALEKGKGITKGKKEIEVERKRKRRPFCGDLGG